MTQREAFEEWWDSLDRGNGPSTDESIPRHAAWSAWQAAQAQVASIQDAIQKEPLPEGKPAQVSIQAAVPTTFLKERAQLEQEWLDLRRMQYQYKAALARLPAVEPVKRIPMTVMECLTDDAISRFAKASRLVDSELAVQRFASMIGMHVILNATPPDDLKFRPDWSGVDVLAEELREAQKAMREALEALCMPCDRWNKQQTEIVNAAIAALEKECGK